MFIPYSYEIWIKSYKKDTQYQELEEEKLENKPQTAGSNKMTYMLLAIVGIILAILGVMEFVVRGMPGRGSGIGAIMLIVGVLLLLFGFFRYSR